MPLLPGQHLPDKGQQIRPGEPVARDSRRQGRLHVAFLVPDQEGSFPVQIMVCQGLQDHPRFGLPAIAGHSQFRDHPFGGMVGTEIEAVDLAAGFPDFFRHIGMEMLHVLLGVVAPGDTALVGHHIHLIAPADQGGHRLSGAGHPFHLVRTADISLIDVQDPVPIQEHRFPFPAHAL